MIYFSELADHFKNRNTPHFYCMMLATTAASSLPFFFTGLFFTVYFIINEKKCVCVYLLL